VVPPPPPVALPPLLVPLTPLPLRRRRRRVSYIISKIAIDSLSNALTTIPPTEKEESDDDMGFGLFD
jgi:hypothetical protein